MNLPNCDYVWRKSEEIDYTSLVSGKFLRFHLVFIANTYYQIFDLKTSLVIDIYADTIKPAFSQMLLSCVDTSSLIALIKFFITEPNQHTLYTALLQKLTLKPNIPTDKFDGIVKVCDKFIVEELPSSPVSYSLSKTEALELQRVFIVRRLVKFSTLDIEYFVADCSVSETTSNTTIVGATFVLNEVQHERDILPVTADYFYSATGYQEHQDDLERCNCPKSGQDGHNHCGWNRVMDLPRFMSSRFCGE